MVGKLQAKAFSDALEKSDKLARQAIKSEARIEQVYTSVKDLYAQLTSKTNESKSVEKEVKELQSIVELVQSELEANKEEHKKLSSGLGILLDRVVKLEESALTSSQSIEGLTKQVKSTSQSLSSLSLDLIKLEAKVKEDPTVDVKQELSKLVSKVSSVSSDVTALQESNIKLSSIESFKELEAKVSDLKGKDGILQSLRKQVKTLTAKVSKQELLDE